MLGVAGLATTISLYGFSWLVVGLGVLFGAGGVRIDRAMEGRLLQGQLSGWFLAAGGTVLGIIWFRKFGPMLSFDSPWPFGIQYTATVYLCWAVVLVLYPFKRHES